MSVMQQKPFASLVLLCALATAAALSGGAAGGIVAAHGVRAAGVPQAGAPTHVRVASGRITATCRLTLGGSFEAASDALEGQLSIAPDGDGTTSGTLRIPLETFDTGIGLRNTHMRENYLETGKGPDFAHATLTQIVLAQPGVAASGGRTSFEARLLLHGVTQDVRGTARVERTGDGARVEATFPVSLSAHGVPEPRYLGIGVRDELEVRVTATFMPGGGSR